MGSLPSRPQRLGVWLFFPPRLVKTKPSLQEHQLDEATDRYLWDGMRVIGERETMKDAMKVVNFCGQFPSLVKKIKTRRVRRNA